MNSRLQSILVVLLLLVLDLSAEQLKPNFTLLIPMRDGTELPTDIYLPEGEFKPYPCILMRNPSGKRALPWVRYAELTKFGYVVAIQDARNAIDPHGKTMPYWSDGWGKEQDGYDTVEWLAKSPFTNGNIGTIGFSAPGITQLLMAPSAPPSLKCQYVGVAASNLYEHCAFNGGQVLKDQVEGWLKSHGNNQGLLSYVTGQPFYNEFWQQLNTNEVAHRVTVPALHYGGWYDIFLNGTIEAFISRQYNGAEGAKGKQKLLIGPWTHRWPATTALGDFEVPMAGRVPPYDFSPQRWFAHYLKGEDMEWEEIPSVTYYVMGPFDNSSKAGNVWKSSNVWPIPSDPKKLYFSGEAKLLAGLDVEGFVDYKYDPDNPSPTIGGRNLFLESGPKDQRIIEEREDVVVFTTDPLQSDLEVTGRVKAVVYFETDCEDTDIVVRLCDVYPDGRSILISDGIHRVGHHRCHQEEAAGCGEIDLVEVDLHTTSIVFAKGHRIRLSVTSSNYPRYEKNMNAKILGEGSVDPKVAHNHIHYGAKHPSHLILPVVK